MIQEFDSHIVITTPNNSVVVQKDSYDHTFGHESAFSKSVDTIGHVRWGAGDNMPNIMKQVMRANHLMPSLLNAIRDLTYGGGIGFFERKIVDNKLELIPFLDNKIEDWAYETQLSDYLISAINQHNEMGNVFARMTYEVKKGWYGLETSDAFMTRIGEPDKFGRITNYKVNPYFGDFGYFESLKNTTTIEAFDFKNDQKNKKNITTIFHCKENMAGNPFYSYPSWWCAKEWLELANLIPVFHKNGIKNGYNIKYLIKIPRAHFDKEGNKPLDEKVVARKWAEFSNNLSLWLAGEKNVNKTMLIKYLHGPDGKGMDSIDVVPMKNEMSDTAYSTVWEMADKSIANATGIMPTLAGVNPGKGNDSGSQVRVMADYQSHFRTKIIQETILKPVLYSLREMGYKDVVPVFKSVQLTTLDANPNGKQIQIAS